MTGASDPEQTERRDEAAAAPERTERRGREPLEPAGVPVAFDAHARAYDKLVNANPGYHDHLRLSTRRMGLSGRGLRLLDIGCGTGASTAALLDAAPGSEVVAVDASAAMLGQARRKNWPPNVRFVHSTLEELEQTGVTGPFDGILAAYLVRNLSDPDAGLRRLYGLLKPGAPLAVHEYSVRDRLRSRIVWDLVSCSVIIPMGRLRSGSADLYRYLWRSVRQFDSTPRFAERLRAAGFVDVKVQTMPGWQQHIVYTFLARRPASDASAAEQAGTVSRPDAPVPGDAPVPENPPSGPPEDAPTPPTGTAVRPPSEE